MHLQNWSRYDFFAQYQTKCVSNKTSIVFQHKKVQLSAAHSFPILSKIFKKQKQRISKARKPTRDDAEKLKAVKYEFMQHVEKFNNFTFETN